MKPYFLANFNVFIRLRGTLWKTLYNNSRMNFILPQPHQSLLHAVLCVTTWPSTPHPTHLHLTMVSGAHYRVLFVIVFLTPPGYWAGWRHSKIHWMIDNSNENSNDNNSRYLLNCYAPDTWEPKLKWHIGLWSSWREAYSRERDLWMCWEKYLNKSWVDRTWWQTLRGKVFEEK